MLQQSSLPVDTWYSFGERCYNYYDTRQAFSPYYDKGTHSLLPPGYRKKLPKTNWNARNIMRYTKIVGKRYKSPIFIASVMAVGVIIGSHYFDSNYCNSWIHDCEAIEAENKKMLQASQPVSNDWQAPKENNYINENSEKKINYSDYLDPFDALASQADYIEFQGIQGSRINTLNGFIRLQPSGKMYYLQDLENLSWKVSPSSGVVLLLKQDKLFTAYWGDFSGLGLQDPDREENQQEQIRVIPASYNDDYQQNGHYYDFGPELIDLEQGGDRYDFNFEQSADYSTTTGTDR